jgi:putative hydrolase of the HAD superfamily
VADLPLFAGVLLRPKCQYHPSVSEPGTAAREPVGIVFDGDDTLWSTEQLYDEARSAAAAVVFEAGLNATEWDSLERRIDVENVAAFGHTAERFPTSCVQAYYELCREARRTPDISVAQRVREAARSVFTRRAPLVAGAIETLSAFRARGHRLALLTKGDEAVQEQRIEQSGLRPYFDLVRIVPEKSPDVIKAVVASLGVDARSAWMVGNSVRSDVLPALEAGLRAVWIDAHVWEYERSHDHLVDDRVFTIRQLGDLPEVIAA